MKKKAIIGIIILAAAAFAAKQFFMKGGPPGGMGQMPPPMVTLTEVKQKEITDTKEHIARVAAKDEVDVMAHVPGYIAKKYYDSGSMVNKGDLLYLIEQDEYESAVAQTKAEIENLKAALWESEKNLKRAKDLVVKDYISKSEYDNKLAIRDKSKAALEAAKAKLKKANYNYRQTRIYAPISGKAGNTVAEGNLVGPAKGPLTTIVMLDPIYVIYNVSADEFTKLRLKLNEQDKDLENAKIKVELPDGTPYPLEGKHYAYHNKVDQTTGTIQIKTLFPNPKGILLPGTMVNAIVYAGEAVKKTVIPQAAVLEDPTGKYVYIVDEENKAQKHRIKTEKQVGTEWIVEEGLQPGEKIILKGIQKIMMPGMKVTVTPPGKEKPGQGKPPAKPDEKPAKKEKADVQ